MRLTSQPMSDTGFAINLSGHDGFDATAHDATRVDSFCTWTPRPFTPALSWLDRLESGDSGRNVTLGGSLFRRTSCWRRGAVLRIDPEFKPSRAPVSAPMTTGGWQRPTAWRVSRRHRVRSGAARLHAGRRRKQYDYTGRAGDRNHPARCVVHAQTGCGRIYRPGGRLNLQFWHLRDRSDTGFRCVVPSTSSQQLRLRDIAVVTEEAPGGGLAGGNHRPPAQAAGWTHRTRFAGVFARAEMIEMRSLRTRAGAVSQQRGDAGGEPDVQAIRLKSAVLAARIMGSSWIANTADYQAGALYEVQGSGRRFEASG